MFIKYLIICISTIIYTQSTIADFSIKKIYNSVVPHKKQQEVIFEEYEPKNTSICSIKNKRGNILVKTTPTQQNISVKAIKKADEPEELIKLTFEQKNNGQECIVESNYDDRKIDGSIDFEIIVPQKMGLNIQANQGNVVIKDAHSPIRAITQKGQIDIINAHNAVDAKTTQKGSIVFRKPNSRINAQTNSGDITIFDAQDSVIANTNHGTIEMFSRKVPSTSTIKLSSVTGSIKLHLPSDVNADIQANTQRGTVISEHFITLKPCTTQLNKNAWKRFQKQIDGILGTGEAQIKLSSVRSDIKLLEMKA